MSIENWKQKGAYFSFKEHRIFYLREGKGEVLLLVHGFPTSSWDWHKIWPALTLRYHIVAADMLGFGFSDKPAGHPYSIFEQADLQEALLNHLQIDAVHILAHDYGNTVTQELMARSLEGKDHPLIRSVCFLNGGLFPEAHKPRLIQELLAGPLGGLIIHFMSKRNLKRSFHNIFGPATPPSEEEIDSFWKLITYNKGKRALPRLLSYIKERKLNRQRWVNALQKTDVPLRLINGPKDPISGRHMAEYYRQQIPRPDVVLLPGIGHYPQIELPNAVLDHFLAFLEKRSI
ncbi:MAG: alpha/beta hydrolase [Saprospiraceae bacterium]|nr:alpha/beta hydrolase [Saprospiraceae bacterium]